MKRLSASVKCKECTRRTFSASGLCNFHDPALAAERSKTARKAAKTRYRASADKRWKGDGTRKVVRAAKKAPLADGPSTYATFAMSMRAVIREVVREELQRMVGNT